MAVKDSAGESNGKGANGYGNGTNGHGVDGNGHTAEPLWLQKLKAGRYDDEE